MSENPPNDDKSKKQLTLVESGSDLQAVVQESLRILTDAQIYLPERIDMVSMFSNMTMQDNFEETMLPMLMRLMQPILSKEVLYPFVKEMCEKYPKWLEENEPILDKKIFDNYTEIFGCMKEIKHHFEKQDDTDDDVTKVRNFNELLELLKKSWKYGQLPPSLLRDLDTVPVPEFSGQCNLM